METGNIYKLIPETGKDEIFETLIKSGSVEIERIISHGHTSPESGWYDQEKSEWVIVFQGVAIIEFENNEKFEFKQGDFINIPAHRKHRVFWTDPNVKTIWLAIHY
jgi:cupin 2 domain-containing protein